MRVNKIYLNRIKERIYDGKYDCIELNSKFSRKAIKYWTYKDKN